MALVYAILPEPKAAWLDVASVVCMRGRKPQPTALKLARNNPGRRPLNENEPVHAVLETDCPEDLVDPIARAEWTRVAQQLSECGQVTTVDRTILIGYCLKYAQWKALEAEARSHPFIVRSPSGYPIPNPVLGMANKVFALMVKAAAELGITPSSRSRVSVHPLEKDDSFAAFQNKRLHLARVK